MNRKPPAARASRLMRGWGGQAVLGALVVVWVGFAGAGCQRTRAIEFIGYACGAPPPLPTVASNPWNCGAVGERCFVDDNLVRLAGGPAALFARPIDRTTAGQPTIVYPLAGAMFPLNLGATDLHWRSSLPFFRAQLTAVADPSRVYTLYLPCRHPPPIPSLPPADACYYPLSRALWTTIAAENPDGEIDLQIAGADPSGSTVAVSPAVRIAFSPSSVHGGIYYWSTDGQGIFRAVLGGGPGLPFLTPPSLDRFSCGGCHSVSDDGRFVAYSGNKNDYSEVGTLTVVDVKNPASPVWPPAPGMGGDGATTSLNRDGSRVLTSFGTLIDPGHLDVRDTATGGELARLDPTPTAVGGGRYFFPQWSPDGREIAATASEGSMTPWSVDSGSIVVLPYGGGGFGSPRVVVPQDDANGLFHYYPTWSPDGAWIAFVSAPLPGPSYGNTQSRLRLVSRAGGRIYELAKATQTIGVTSTYPRFAPVMQDQCNVLYLTFQSKMDYGNLVRNSAQPTADSQLPQLWMTAIDLRALDSGDPSHPPVWLPFQSSQRQNLLGTWTERILCRGQSDCGAATDATCDPMLGECVPALP